MGKDFFQAVKAVTIKEKVGRLRMENDPFQGPQDCEEFRLKHRIVISNSTGSLMRHNSVYVDVERLRHIHLRARLIDENGWIIRKAIRMLFNIYFKIGGLIHRMHSPTMGFVL